MAGNVTNVRVSITSDLGIQVIEHLNVVATEQNAENKLRRGANNTGDGFVVRINNSMADRLTFTCEYLSQTEEELLVSLFEAKSRFLLKVTYLNEPYLGKVESYSNAIVSKAPLQATKDESETSGTVDFIIEAFNKQTSWG